MPPQPSRFHRLPATVRIQELAASYQLHGRDIAQLMWYILPAAEHFGEHMYEIAAAALTEDGLEAQRRT